MIIIQLYFKQEYIGDIENINVSDEWLNAKFKPNHNTIKFLEMFQDLVNEDLEFDCSKYDLEYLEDKNWFIIDDDKIKGICVPAIYKDGDIYWRWR